MERELVEAVLDLLVRKTGSDCLVLFGDASGAIREDFSDGREKVEFYGVDALASFLLDEPHTEVRYVR